jgi:glutathione S-transferase
MITLYHAPMSRSSRFLWLLEEIGRPYEIRPVNIQRQNPQPSGAADPANPHPAKQVPCLVDDGVVIPESVAIALYLADAFPDAGLGPRIGDADRGPWLAWHAWYLAALEPAMFAHFEGALDQPLKKKNYDQVVARLQETLSKGPWILGDRFTTIDMLVGSALGWARQAFPASETFDAYVRRCQERPACQRGVALDNASGVQHGETVAA